jgi:hypothetical protein
MFHPEIETSATHMTQENQTSKRRNVKMQLQLHHKMGCDLTRTIQKNYHEIGIGAILWITIERNVSSGKSEICNTCDSRKIARQKDVM